MTTDTQLQRARELRRRAQIMRDTAQMRTQFPAWLLAEMEAAAESLEEAAAILAALSEQQGVPEFDRARETSRRQAAVNYMLAIGAKWDGKAGIWHEPTDDAQGKPAEQGQRPVRYVRWHPKHGYRWADTFDEFHGDYTHTGWTSKPLYADPQPAVPEGWDITDNGDGSRTIKAPGRIGDLTVDGFEDDKPSRMLAQLAAAMRAAKPEAKV